MYLYDGKDEFISVYDMQPNFEKIYAYRKDHTMFPDGDVFRIESNDKKAPLNFEELKSRPVTDFSLEEICYNKKGFTGSHHLMYFLSDEMQQTEFITKHLKSYQEGFYDNMSLVRVYHYNDELKQLEFIRHFLIASDYIYKRKYGQTKFIEGIINIPEEAFTLELLKRGHFSTIVNVDISEQIKLFDFSEQPILIVPRDDINHLSTLCLIKVDENTQDKVSGCQKVLRYARN